MATLEVAYDSAPFADYLVASANLLWVVNIYPQLLDVIAAQTNNPAEVAKGIVAAYTARVSEKVPGGVYSNMAAFDLSKVGAVVTTVSELGSLLQNALDNETTPPTIRPLIDRSRADAQVYDSSSNNLLDQIYDPNGVPQSAEEDAFVDIRHFAQLIKERGPANSVNAAQAVIDAINDGLIIASEQRSGFNSAGRNKALLEQSNASGIGLFFPDGGEAGQQGVFRNAYLAGRNYETYLENTDWDDFLRVYASATVGQAPGGIGRRGDPVSGNTSFGILYVPMARR
jgi:hypothetical protein